MDPGFLDAAVAPDSVVETAIAEATAMVDLDRGAYAGTVRALRGSTLDRMAETTMT